MCGEWMHKRRYVDNLLGPGRDQELFYTDPAVRGSYMNYVRPLIIFLPFHWLARRLRTHCCLIVEFTAGQK